MVDEIEDGGLRAAGSGQVVSTREEQNAQ